MDNIRIKKFFDGKLAKYGAGNLRSLAWSSSNSMRIRYKVLSGVANLKNQKILDIGSGFSNFYSFIKKYNVKYTGIDISEKICEISLAKHPETEIMCGDFFTYNFTSRYDYVFCCGSFNILQPNHIEYLHAAINKMYRLCKKGIAFNLPSNMGDWTNETYAGGNRKIKIAYVSPTNIFKYCKSISPYVTLRHDYLPRDFTIYMYKRNFNDTIL